MLLKSDYRVSLQFDNVSTRLRGGNVMELSVSSARFIGLRWVGGAKEDRTPDLLRARQALSQLSYGPNVLSASSAPFFRGANSAWLLACRRLLGGGPGRTRTSDLTLIRGAL